jgi:hemin uptake protein HemP
MTKKQLFPNYNKDLQLPPKRGIIANANYSHLYLTEPYSGKKTAMSKSMPSEKEITKCTDLSARKNISKVAVRIRSQDLFQNQREVEIEHEDRIYRLQITQLNKLILTA